MANKHHERLRSLPGWRPKGHRPKCQQCHRELLPVYQREEVDYDPFIDGHGPGAAVPTSRKVNREVRVKGWGYNGATTDQLTMFCSLRCGFGYACRVFRGRGRVMQPGETDEIAAG